MSGIDWDLMDTATLERALSGNMQPLIEKIRSGATLRDEERAFIADRLEGKKTLKRGRKAALQRKDFEVMIALNWLENVEKCTRKSALYALVDLIGESVENVRNREKRAKAMVPDNLGFYLKHQMLSLSKDPLMFKMAKASECDEQELDLYRPALLRNAKLEK